MPHFAKVINGLVVEVNVTTQEWVEAQPHIWYVKWVQTSYNLYGGVYYNNATGQPVENQAEAIAAQDGRQRKNYAGIGYRYDEALDAFIPPRPYPSWVLNEETCLWEAPVPYPEGGGMYTWNEDTQSWDAVEVPE